MKAVDVSRWSAPGGLVSMETWRRLRERHGIELAIIGAWHGASPNPGARQSVLNAVAAGIPYIHTYTALGPALPGAAHVMRAREAVGADVWMAHVSRCWLDCELDGITSRMIAEAYEQTLRFDTPTGIYTARWWWVDHFGNPTRWSWLPLWNAVYDYDPDVDFPRAPYGGWTEPWGEQYQGTTLLEGIQVDLNYFYDHRIRGGAKVPEAETERRLTKAEGGLTREKALRVAAAIFQEAAAYVSEERPLPETLKAQLRFLLG